MSASNQKKIRKEQAMAYMSERQRKEAEEQKKLKRYTLTFWIILALCLCIVLSTVLAAPVTSMIMRNTNAVTVGNHTLSAVELNYFYLDAINEWYNSYGNYATYFGLSTSTPLNEQTYDKTLGTTWADMFLNMALENIKSTYALYDLAMADKDFKLSDEEQAALDTMIEDLDETIASYKELYQNMGYTYNYSNAKEYLQGMYGKAATTASYKAYYEVCTIANAYYTAHHESLEYDDAALRAYENDKFEQYSSYTYAYYNFKTSDFLEGGTKSEDGKTTTYSDEEKAAAAAVAKKLADELASGSYDSLDAFDKAINDMLTKHFGKKDEQTTKTTEGDTTTDGDTTTEGETTTDGDTTTDSSTEDKEEDKLTYVSTKQEDQLYSSINSLFIEWLIGKIDADGDAETEDDVTYEVRQEGDLTVIVSESGSGDSKTVNGYYVIRFGSVNENKFALKNVRHLLVAFEGGTYNSTTGTTTYTESEKKKAKADAEMLLAEFKAGAMTEEAFTAMIKEHSDDKDSEGNVNYDGLYEDIYPGQMVEAFEEWCFEEGRKTGDVGLVETNYGWHIMYFVSDSETTYRDFMLENDLRSEEMEEWHKSLVDATTLKVLTDKYVEKDMILG